MPNSLGNITNEGIRDTIGNRCFTSAGLAIHGTNAENVLTAAAVVHCVNGKFQSNLAAQAQIDLSAATFISGKDGSSLSAPVTKAAIAADGKADTIVYLLACKGSSIVVVEPDVESNAAQGSYNDHSLSCPAGYAPFGAIKVVRAAGAAAFTLGTTNLSGVTGQTTTFHSLSVCPAYASDLA